MKTVAKWSMHSGMSAAEHHVILHAAADQPCNNQCPWLEANHGLVVELEYDHEVPGIPMSPGPYSFDPSKRVQIWENNLQDGICGYGNVCHVRLKGTHEREDGSWQVARQCVGALVMQQRELIRHLEHRSSALSRAGAARVASELLGRPVTEEQLDAVGVDEVKARAHLALVDDRIGCSEVASPLSDREVRAWQPDRNEEVRHDG